jgi:hypothetical protein
MGRRCPCSSAEYFRASQRDERQQDSDLKLSLHNWHLPVVSLETDANLVRPVDSQLEGNPFIKITMRKPDVLDINGANKSACKLCELAEQRDPLLTQLSKAVKVVSRQRSPQTRNLML